MANESSVFIDQVKIKFSVTVTKNARATEENSIVFSADDEARTQRLVEWLCLWF